MDINGSIQVSGQINASDATKEVNVKTTHCKWVVLFTPLSLIVFIVMIFLYTIHSNPIFIFKFLFLVFAIANSLIYGLYAFEIHNMLKSDNVCAKYNQYWLNGLGAFLGWAALYILIFHRIGHVGSERFMFDFSSWASKLEWVDFILILFAFVGVTGYLPHVIVQGKIPGK